MMSAPVPGQKFEVRARLANRFGVPISLEPNGASLQLAGDRGWNVSAMPGASAPAQLSRHQLATSRFLVTVSDDAPLSTRPYYARTSSNESRYTLSDASQFGRPAARQPLVAVARYSVNGIPIVQARSHGGHQFSPGIPPRTGSQRGHLRFLPGGGIRSPCQPTGGCPHAGRR